jgi:hypothetical protein
MAGRAWVAAADDESCHPVLIACGRWDSQQQFSGTVGRVMVDFNWILYTADMLFRFSLQEACGRNNERGTWELIPIRPQYLGCATLTN